MVLPITKNRCEDMIELIESYSGLPCPSNATLDRALGVPNGTSKNIIQMLLRKKRLKRFIEDGWRRRLLVVASGKETAATKDRNHRGAVLGKCRTPVWIAGSDTGDYEGTDHPVAAATASGVYQRTQPTRMADLEKVHKPDRACEYPENN